MIIDGFFLFTGTSNGASVGITSTANTDAPTIGTQDSSNIVDIGVKSGPGVWNVANDSIGQFLSAAEAKSVSGNQALTGSSTDASLSDPQTNSAPHASVDSGIFAAVFGAGEPLLDDALNFLEGSIQNAMTVSS